MAARRPELPYDPRIQTGITYARDVVAGNIKAGRWVRLACARFLKDLELAESGRGP
jgi:hypothetical protein